MPDSKQSWLPAGNPATPLMIASVIKTEGNQKVSSEFFTNCNRWQLHWLVKTSGASTTRSAAQHSMANMLVSLGCLLKGRARVDPIFQIPLGIGAVGSFGSLPIKAEDLL